jgi:hypothetical protein
MTATTVKGKTKVNFWENLGFDVKELTVQYDKNNPNKPLMNYSKFINISTRDFTGAGNIYAPITIVNGTNEPSFASFVDSNNLLGWYANPLQSRDKQGGGTNFDICTTTPQYVLANHANYFAVSATVPILANKLPSDDLDSGHSLIEIQGYNGSLITDNDFLAVKTLVSNYFTNQSSFVTNANIDSAIYEHIGQPLKLSTFKIRIINPITRAELTNVGKNSSIYLEITSQLQLKEK